MLVIIYTCISLDNVVLNNNLPKQILNKVYEDKIFLNEKIFIFLKVYNISKTIPENNNNKL